MIRKKLHPSPQKERDTVWWQTWAGPHVFHKPAKVDFTSTKYEKSEAPPEYSLRQQYQERASQARNSTGDGEFIRSMEESTMRHCNHLQQQHSMRRTTSSFSSASNSSGNVGSPSSFQSPSPARNSLQESILMSRSASGRRSQSSLDMNHPEQRSWGTFSSNDRSAEWVSRFTDAEPAISAIPDNIMAFGHASLVTRMDPLLKSSPASLHTARAVENRSRKHFGGSEMTGNLSTTWATADVYAQTTTQSFPSSRLDDFRKSQTIERSFAKAEPSRIKDIGTHPDVPMRERSDPSRSAAKLLTKSIRTIHDKDVLFGANFAQ
eukprot:ANDGO_01653.mRNA.1 hypothetical protein